MALAASYDETLKYGGRVGYPLTKVLAWTLGAGPFDLQGSGFRANFKHQHPDNFARPCAGPARKVLIR
jgi:hypothetical protein